MSKHQFRSIMSVAWLSVLMSCEESSHAMISFLFVLAYGIGSIYAMAKKE